jgi:CRISPR/Cas system CMR subunit Cmr4 (Cas7 group RAMP superfamily)
MNRYKAHWENSRDIVQRIVIKGVLELLTPTHLGNGAGDDPTDMSLLRDTVENTRALLTGTSLAGALRNYF